MWQLVLQYLTVVGLGAFKFVFAPIVATAMGLSLVEVILLTIAGMMTSVTIITLLGAPLRIWYTDRFNKKRLLFSKRNRNMVIAWRKYGLWGVAMLTPILFTPIGGSLIATAFGEKKHKIMITMLVSAVFWAVVLGGGIFFFGNRLIG